MSVEALQGTQVSASNFHSLEEKVYKTIELLKSVREAKAALERDAARLREQVQLCEEEIETLRNENVTLRKEREDVRGRVEKLLEQIDSIAVEAE